MKSRSTLDIRTRGLCAAVALILAPGAFASGMPVAPYAGLGWYLVSFELGQWENYLVRELTPDLDMVEPLPEPEITWMAGIDRAIMPEFAAKLLEGKAKTIPFSWSTEIRSSLDGQFLPGSDSTPGLSFERQLINPGFARRLDDANVMSVSAVLAKQQFSSGVLGIRHEDEAPIRDISPTYQPYDEVSYGTGMRFALKSELAPGLSMDAAIQSRIDMDEFTSYRGVYGQSAELDIPPRAEVGLEFRAGENSSLNFAISQVFYSEVSAFPSRQLPARFLSLLNDSSSPEFAWQDLTVYTVGWRWRHESDIEFHIDYSSRTQPSPTASSLARALDEELADQSLVLGLSRPVGRNGRLHLNAAYAPPEYAFGGNVLGVVTNQFDQELEVEALWSWRF